MCSVVSLRSISQQEKGFQAVSLNEVLFGCGFTALEHMLECRETMHSFSTGLCFLQSHLQ